MHPLSIEDLLHQGGHALSKADYYPKHMFIRVLCHTLCHTSQGSNTAAGLPVLSSSSPFTHVPRSASPQHFEGKLGMTDQGVYEDFYGNNVDPTDDFEIGRATPDDPEMGRRKASLLVCDLYVIPFWVLLTLILPERLAGVGALSQN
jgi:hypothetical protein